MSGLIAAFVEALVGLVMAFVEALPAIIEGLVYILTASVTIIAYAVSPAFRRRKRQQWADKPAQKYLDLGISGVCLVSLIALAAWIAWPTSAREKQQLSIEQMKGETNEDARLNLKVTVVNEATNQVSVAVKKGGTRKIFETRSMDELRAAIKENVTVIHPSDTNRPGHAANNKQQTPSETNQPPPASPQH